MMKNDPRTGENSLSVDLEQGKYLIGKRIALHNGNGACL
jgi:hypothetical protein